MDGYMNVYVCGAESGASFRTPLFPVLGWIHIFFDLLYRMALIYRVPTGVS